MVKKFVHLAVSEELKNEIDEMIIRIKNAFGVELTKFNASKIIAWKSKRYNVLITQKKLLEIIGGKL